MAAESLDKGREAGAVGTEGATSTQQTEKLPPGMVLGPDGKP